MKGTKYTCTDCSRQYYSFADYENWFNRCPHCEDKRSRISRFNNTLARIKNILYYFFIIWVAVFLCMNDNIWLRIVGTGISSALLIQVIIRHGPGMI